MELIRVKAKAGCEGCYYLEQWTEGTCPHVSECGDSDNEYIFIASNDGPSEQSKV